jgi:uncharacterized protein (TIGR02246 family)
MTTVTTPDDLNHAWADAFNAGDLPRLMEMYEPDAVLVPGPGADPLQGHDAIEAALEQFLALRGRLRFTPRHWLVAGELALGSIAFVMDDGHDADGHPVDLRGTTAEVVRRQADGTWKYVIDHPFGGGA